MEMSSTVCGINSVYQLNRTNILDNIVYSIEKMIA